jgi:hypothetical protein
MNKNSIYQSVLLIIINILKLDLNRIGVYIIKKFIK